VAVVELGMNHAGELRVLTAIAEPDVRVWTNVAEVHAEFFASLDAIADAKAEILEGATPDTLVVANAADACVMARVRACPARLVTFGIGVDADVTARDVRVAGVTGTAATLVAGGRTAAVTVPLIGLGHLANVLAATAVALEFGVPLDAIAGRVAQLQAAPRRGELRRLRDGILLVDDSYNSNPRALERMLDALADTPAAGRRIAVLGEMLELGAQGPALHHACGRHAAAAGLAQLVVIGGDAAAALASGARDGGMAAGTVTHLAASQEAAAAVAATVGPGDVVLVKGSRGIRTDIVADRLAAELAG
jgi:UDP-N-acetylmuramoyl-tripeptide--D-alanyl-D-alanine ligase